MRIYDYQLLTLSALVRYPKLRDEFAYRLTESMFDDAQHVYLVGKLKRVATFTDLVEETTKIGGLPYLRNLGNLCSRAGRVSSVEVGKWLEILSNHAKKQELSYLLDTTRGEIERLQLTAEVDPLISGLMTGLVDTYGSRSAKGFSTIESIADFALMELLDLERGFVRSRTKTGFPSLDGFLRGGLPHGLVVLAGLPGTGKTTLALQWGFNVAKALQRRVVKSKGRFTPGVVCIVSAEMTSESLLLRMAQSETGIEIKPGISVDPLVRYIERNRGLPILVDDSDMLTTNLIYQRCESTFMRYGAIRYIVIDFAELITDDSEGDSRERQVSLVYIRAKILSKRYGCPVVVISHLSRESESSRTKVPSMSHLRYTRLAEGLADLVLLIYDPYQFVLTGKPVPTPPTMPAVAGTAYLIADKNRTGPTGTVVMGWQREITKWIDAPQSGMYHKVSAQEVLALS